MKNSGARFGFISLLFTSSLFAEPKPDPDAYFDPVDQRIHAAVESSIENGQLSLSVSALGAMVEPLPGFRGRSGSNLQTAFEIDQLFATDRLKVITTDAFGNRMADGYLTPGKRGRIPLRTIDSHGVINFDALSDVDYLLDFSASGGALPAGEFRTELWARGEPRLRVDYQIDPAGNGNLLDFVEIGHDEKPPADASQQFRYIDTEGEEAEKELPPPVEAAVWEARDFEAKWSLYKQTLDGGKTNAAWVQFLLKREDYLFLETVAMHELDTFGNAGIGQKLKAADAPNWLRLTFWMAEDKRPRGHGGMVTDGLIYDKGQQDVITSWLKAHKLEKLHATLSKHFAAEEPKPKDADISKYLPPHDAAKFFQLLEAPAELKTLAADAKKSEPGAVYLQQVKRAIGGLVTSGRYEYTWTSKLEKLRTHTDPAVRQAVYLGLTHMGFEHIPANTLAVVNDQKEDPRVREAALLAYSNGHHFEYYPAIITIALDPQHPAWRASISKINSLADPYAVEILSALKVESPEDGPFFQTNLTSIKKRADTMATKHASILVPNILQRYAWMKAVGDERAEAYLESSGPTILKAKGAIKADLEKLSTAKISAKLGASAERRKLFETMNATVQKLANEFTSSP